MSPSSRILPRNPILPPHRSAPFTLQRLAQPKPLPRRTGVQSAVGPQHSHESRVQESILLLQRFESLETGVDSGGGSVGVVAGSGGGRGPQVLRGDVWETFAER